LSLMAQGSKQRMCTQGLIEGGRAEGERSATPDFDRLARIYKWMEWASFGPWLQLCRCAFLDRFAGCRRALIFGDGDGRFAERLLRSNPRVAVDAVDASAAMLGSLMRRAGTDGVRIRTHHADAREWKPERALKQGVAERYDLVATHFFVDCLTTAEVRGLAERIRPALESNAVWVISDFAVPTGWFGRLVATPLVTALYWAFGILTGLTVRCLPEHSRALGEAGFELSKRRIWLGGLLVSELWISVG
jgi:hypothetical protein